MLHPEGPSQASPARRTDARSAEASYANLSPADLVEHAIVRGEGRLADNGALVVRTGAYTGRSPKDKYIVDEPTCHDFVWWGSVNHPLAETAFHSLERRVRDYLQGRAVFVQDLYGGADARYAVPVRVVTEYAWHSLFARQLLIRPSRPGTPGVESAAVVSAGGGDAAGFTLLVAPGCVAVPEEDGTQSETFIVVNFKQRLALIGGTEYAGEIKKCVFTILNYLLPRNDVLTMHCSANTGDDATALFFGLSGTGKTSLSADPGRALIGDDEHAWTDEGIFNLEGGCYAKCIRLKADAEPQIWHAIRFGAVLENVVMDPDRRSVDYQSASLTENTRAAYPVEFIPGARVPGVAGHPRHILFLSADAFGVLPPISRLTFPQARFHFLSGYTAKVAGTERGLSAEPQAVFSTCFAHPFLPLPPTVYSRMLGEKLARHKVSVWLVNTGWTGGAYGSGERIPIQHTRAMVNAAISGALDDVECRVDQQFGLAVPRYVPGVPDALLDPRGCWPDKGAYDAQAAALAARFVENFKQYRDSVPEEVAAAAPKV